jgi:negative regulator of flagellin synthesis FlgM
VKIDNSVKSVGSVSAGETRAHPVKGQPAAPAAPAAAQVELSSLASRMHEIEAAMANVAVVDMERVAEIKQAISEGRFKVDAERVADSLIQSVRQMLASQSGKA